MKANHVMSDRFIEFIREILFNIARCLHPRNWLYYLLGAGLGYALIHKGIDWNWFQFFSLHHEFQYVLIGAAIIGMIMPAIGPIILFKGMRRQDKKLIESGRALIQAVMIALLISSVIKAFTGRFPPEPFSRSTVEDFSNHLRFGFLEGGIFEGWPSGHTMTAFAMIAIVVCIHRSNVNLIVIACLYGMYMLIGVSATIHWLSDSLAGAIIGTSIGLTISRNIERESRSNDDKVKEY